MAATAHDAPPLLIGRSVRDSGLHNLPQPMTSFIGRQREIAKIGRLLGVTRLLTLTGTGGVGKTRLSHEVAASLLNRSAGHGTVPSVAREHAFEDGIWLIELAALADPLLVPQAVATVLGVSEERDLTLTASLVATLHSKRVLLILDNCELLVEACAELANALLRSCPGLRILATSRQPLGITGETTFRVPSLSVTGSLHAPLSPVADDDETYPSAEASEAARLFVERARATAPDFTPTERNSAAVEQICRRLDGIPLAIELAAARVSVLSPEQIAARLGDRFRLLTGGSRTALPRYRTLRALIDWSHDLLEDKEKILLRRLAVFTGGWTLEAAEAVCDGDGLASEEILDLLSGLVAQSLVLTDDRADEVRYTFLETLRAYAAERLSDANEEPILRERHRDWFLALAERTEPALEHAEEVGWFDRLDAEHDNLRAVERWAATQGDAETVVRLGAALWHYWMMQADAADVRERVDTILALAASTPLAPARAKALDGAGVLARLLGDYPAARALGEESLVLARHLNDRRCVAAASYNLGRLALAQVRYGDARVLLEEALSAFRQLGHESGVAAALNRLGLLAFTEGDLAGARALLEHSLEAALQTGSARLVGSVRYNLGLCAHCGGDLEVARRLYEEWRAINTTARGDRHDLAAVLHNLGHVIAMQGDLATARVLCSQSLVIAREVGNRRRLVLALWTIATLAAAERDWERAVRLRGSAEAAAEAIGVEPARPMQAIWDAQLEPAPCALGSPRLAAAVAAGRSLTLDQAVDEALGWLAEPAHNATVIKLPARDEPPPPVPGQVALAPAPRGGLGVTRRELEVAALIARGYSNRQIAQELVITEGTAASHVKHILARLVLDSRVQIATWAVEHGLHQFPSSQWDAAS